MRSGASIILLAVISCGLIALAGRAPAQEPNPFLLPEDSVTEYPVAEEAGIVLVSQESEAAVDDELPRLDVASPQDVESEERIEPVRGEECEDCRRQPAGELYPLPAPQEAVGPYPPGRFPPAPSLEGGEVAAPLFEDVLNSVPNSDSVVDPLAGQGFDGSCPGGCAQGCPGGDDCNPLKRFSFYSHLRTCDQGIGYERVAYAPFDVELTQPFNNIRLRMDSAFGMQTPDRAEYFWAKIGTGPKLPERSVNYQDLRLVSETGGRKFSVTTSLPLRLIEPSVNPNGSGLSNISIAPKFLLVDGQNWQVSQIFRTYLPTGSESRGTSNGHVSLEPGLLLRYKWNDRMYFHGQVKYWIPIGGDSNFQGSVLNHSYAVSRVLYDSDALAVIPTLELGAWSVLDGSKTLSNGTVVPVHGDTFFQFQPGARFVLGPAGDLGLFELGIGAGFNIGPPGWYDALARVELRWSY